MESSDVFARSPDAISCDLGAGAAILNSRTNLYFTLNPTGVLAWEMLPASTEQIIVRLMEDFGVGRQVVEPDVTALLAQLKANGLISPAEATLSNASPAA